MADLDALAPNFRRARDRWPDGPTLCHCYDALTGCFASNSHGLVEHVKSFVESVCLTILTEFREPMPSSMPSTTELLVAALRPLGLQNTKGASKLDKVLSGFNRLSDALTEMRNDHGVVAHGKDAYLDTVAADHARAFLHVGDAILSILLNALEGKDPDLTTTREPYERFSHFNERIDRAVAVGVRIDEDGDWPMVVVAVSTRAQDEDIEIRIEPSRLLYGIDRSAYIEVLKTAAVTGAVMEREEDDQPTAPIDLGQAEFGVASPSTPLTEVVQSYEGRLKALRPSLEGFLGAEGVRLAETLTDDADLTDSLLATADDNMGLDWKQRDALRSRLKIAFKRVLVRFELEPVKVEGVAERLVTWMDIQVPDASEMLQGTR